MTIQSNSWSKFATIMDYNDTILDNNFALSSIIIHTTPVRISSKTNNVYHSLINMHAIVAIIDQFEQTF